MSCRRPLIPESSARSSQVAVPARAAESAGFGAVTYFELEAERGRVMAAGRNGLVIVAVAEPRVNVGLLRVELVRAAEGL